MATTITTSTGIKLKVKYKNPSAGVITHIYTKAGGGTTSETF